MEAIRMEETPGNVWDKMTGGHRGGRKERRE